VAGAWGEAAGVQGRASPGVHQGRGQHGLRPKQASSVAGGVHLMGSAASQREWVLWGRVVRGAGVVEWRECAGAGAGARAAAAAGGAGVHDLLTRQCAAATRRVELRGVLLYLPPPLRPGLGQCSDLQCCSGDGPGA